MAESRLRQDALIDDLITALKKRDVFDQQLANELHLATRAKPQRINAIMRNLVPHLDDQELFYLTQAAMLGHFNSEAKGATQPFLRATNVLSGTLYKIFAERIGYDPAFTTAMSASMAVLNKIVFDFKCSDGDAAGAKNAAVEIHFKLMKVSGDDVAALTKLQSLQDNIRNNVDDAFGAKMRAAAIATLAEVDFAYINSVPLDERCHPVNDLSQSLPLLAGQSMFSLPMIHSAPPLVVTKKSNYNLDITSAQDQKLTNLVKYFAQMQDEINVRERLDARKKMKHNFLTAVIQASMIDIAKNQNALPADIIKAAFRSCEAKQQQIDVDVILAGRISKRMRNLIADLLGIEVANVSARMHELYNEMHGPQILSSP